MNLSEIKFWEGIEPSQNRVFGKVEPSRDRRSGMRIKVQYYLLHPGIKKDRPKDSERPSPAISIVAGARTTPPSFASFARELPSEKESAEML